MHAAGYLEHEISQRVRKSLEFIFYYTKNDTKRDNRMTIKNTTPITMAHNPALTAPSQVEFQLEGEIGRRLAAVTEQWVLPAPLANPGMLAMFHERDRLPLRNMMPWHGEFAGKYLTHAVEILELTRNPRLDEHLRWFVRELISGQDKDGYLGPWPKKFRLGLAGLVPNVGTVWDAWGHYHVMLGLLKWHELSGDSEALAATRRIADLLCTIFLGTGRRIHEVGAEEMNMAPYHSLLLLFEKTGDVRYFQLAEDIEKDFEKPQAGDYVRTALQGMEFSKTPKPRWESLHAIQGIAEKYFITGDVKYRQAFEHLWWSMLKGDRHNNGGFTSGEQCSGNPYQIVGAIETCCTVAWTAMSVDMLRMTGESVVADELELTLFNSGLGLMNPSGRWVTYDTPMEGRRESSTHSIVFQSRAGTNELNCCSVNGPRVMSSIVNWAIMRRDESLVLNYYGPGTLACQLPSGRKVKLTQTTTYPLSSQVEICLGLESPETFKLELRIPYWSENTSVSVGGKKIGKVEAGKYLVLDRQWQPNDLITIDFDFHTHYWVQDQPAHFYSNWETEWRVFGSASVPSREERLALLAKFADLPDTLDIGNQSFSGVNVKSVGGELNFKLIKQTPFHSADTFFAFTEIESESDALMPIRVSAAWWSVITVNGQKVFDDDSCGFDGDVSLCLHRLDLPLRKGRNLIGWAVTKNPNHVTWSLTAGKSRLLPGSSNVSDKNDYKLASIYRGPLLLAFDHRFNSMDAENLPGLDASQLREQLVNDNTYPKPWLLLEYRDVNGQPLRLCDFASAGETGNPYRTWFNVKGVRPVEFSRENSRRSSAADDMKT